MDNNRVSEAPKQPSELERLYLLLADQKEVLAKLQDRLQPVSHHAQAETTDQLDRPNPQHLAQAADILSDNNSWLRQIVTELAI